MLFYPDEPREVEWTDRKTGVVAKCPVFSILLADSTSPAGMEFWGDIAESTLEKLNKWSEESDSLLWVEIKYFRIRIEKGDCFQQMRKILANERTTIMRCDDLDIKEMSPPDALHTNDFSVLDRSPPFVVNLTGVVSSIQLYKSFSKKGVSMKSFKLQDRQGRFVNCMACGRHVDNSSLECQNEITLFFAVAKSGLYNEPSALWIYDNAHIKFNRRGSVIAKAQVCMTLQ